MSTSLIAKFSMNNINFSHFARAPNSSEYGQKIMSNCSYKLLIDKWFCFIFIKQKILLI